MRLYFSVIFIFSFFFISLVPNVSWGGLYFHHSLFYYSTTDNAEAFTNTGIRNILFFGAPLGQTGTFVLGQNIGKWSSTRTDSGSSNESTIDILELGPRLSFFFNAERTLSITAAYNPYAKGTRTLASTGSEEKISGSSIFAHLNYLLKITKSFYLGASLNYHSFSVAESVLDSVESEIAHSYSYIYPTIDLNFRF